MPEIPPRSIIKRMAAGILRRVFDRLRAVRHAAGMAYAWVCILVIGLCDAVRLLIFDATCCRRSRLFQSASTRTGSAQPLQTPRNASAGCRALRIAFVIPWYGKNIGGGAEAEARGLIHALKRFEPDLEIEVLTTTLKEFAADWNTPFHSPGVGEEDGITVRRFQTSRPDRRLFHFLNGRYLMQSAGPCPRDPRRSPVPRFAEAYFLRRMIRSAALLDYMAEHREDYDAFVMIPYMFSMTVEGCLLAGARAMLIPCLHDERYAYMHIYRKAFARIGAALCHVRSEAALFSRLYPSAPPPALIGEQVDVDVTTGDAERFRRKYGITSPFVLYAGRQVEGKNLPLMVEYFNGFRKTHPEWSDLQFVLIGKGDLDYSATPGVRSLGFVPAEDKIDAYRAALGLVMLSKNESFSIVLMEAWLQETPVIVSSECAVTTDHVHDSGGGYAVGTPGAFAAALSELLSVPERPRELGARGRRYVLANFTPEKVTARFREELNRLVSPGI
jgi:glycosyltransferase involved in cell wall biosynthesis